MTQHALDAMIYAWTVMKEKEESSMEGIYVGKVKRSVINKDDVNLLFIDHRQDIHHLSEVIDYEDTAYCLVPTNDIIINNDELLKLRDEVKRLTEACNGWEAECNDWKGRYAKVNNELFQKGLAYGMLEGEYKKEKIAGELLLKDRDALKEERDRWKNRWNSVVTDIAKSLEANGIEFTLKEVHSNGNWDVVIDIPELNEAKKKVEDLEKKLKAAKSNENYWRDRKEEEEEYHHYWAYTFDRAVKQAADKGIHIDVRGTDEDCNAGIVVVDNVKAEELEKQMVETFADLEKRLAATKSKETYWQHTFNRAVTQAEQKGVYIGVSGNDEEYNAGVVIVDNGKANELESQVVQMKDANQKLHKRISAADEEIDRLKGDNSAKAKAVIRAEYRGDAWMDEHEKLIRKYHELKQRHDAKWSAMTEALKDKGVEVIYMGEQDGKPIIDIKVPGWDELKEQCDILRKDGVLKGQQCLKLKEDLNALKKEHDRVLGEFALCRKQAECDHKKLEELKSRTLDNVEIRLSCGDIVWTYCDGFVHVSSMFDGIISADQITTGTIPKCSSCVHYMHNPSRFAHDWCYRPVPKEGGAGYIRKLNKEEAEGPACGDFKARKE